MTPPQITRKELVLPNAEHINRVLGHAFREPHKWRHFKPSDAWSLAEQTARLRVPDYVVWMLTNRAKLVVVSPMWLDSAQSIVFSISAALLALAAWNDCAYMLDLHPDVVRTLAGSGDYAAALLLPAAIAMNGDDDGSYSTSTEGIRPETV